jgi:hypothetical protein
MIEMTFRVSELESYRQWRDDEDADLDLLLARLRGQTEASEAMLAGTAFHKALEVATVGSAATLDFEIALPTIREVRAGKTYAGENFAITISGQLDAIDGKRVEDHKTTGRFDPERYMTGYQWRLYLEIFGADVFRWNIFEIAATDDPLAWDVHSFHRLEQYRYPGMGMDCERLALSLGEFAIAQMPERLRNLKVAA